MENFSLHYNYSSELTETSTSPAVLIGRPRHLFILVLNIFLSITASVGNALILVALHKETSLHPPTKLLFRCLAVTDLCVGLITQPLYAVAVMLHGTKTNWVVLNYFITGRYISSYMRSIELDINRNKRGQTSRTVIGTEIQTSCHTVAG